MKGEMESGRERGREEESEQELGRRRGRADERAIPPNYPPLLLNVSHSPGRVPEGSHFNSISKGNRYSMVLGRVALA